MAKKNTYQSVSTNRRKSAQQSGHPLKRFIVSIKRSPKKTLFMLSFALIATFLAIGALALCQPEVIKVEPGQAGQDGTGTCVGSGCQDGASGSGTPGTAGSSNPGSATQGSDGADGAAGSQGSSGTSGSKGTQGADGADGTTSCGTQKCSYNYSITCTTQNGVKTCVRKD